MNHELTPEQLRLAEYLYKLPMSYAVPCYFGNPSKEDIRVNNGTATLIRYKEELYAVSNHHVLDHFRERRKTEDVHFYVGRKKLELGDVLLSESEENDLAVLYLGGLDESDISIGGDIQIMAIEVNDLSTGDLKPGDFVMLGGFPGIYRKQPKKDELYFESFSSGSSEVNDVNDRVISVSFNRELCIVHTVDGRDFPADLGGISGGPVIFEEKTVVVN